MAKKRVSQMGYRDDSPYRNRKSIKIHTPNGLIDMSETGIPLMANGVYLPPYSGMHQFDTTEVTEVPMQQGGQFQGFSKEELDKLNKSATKSRYNTGLASVDRNMPTPEEIENAKAAKIVADKREITRRKNAIRTSNAATNWKEQMAASSAAETYRMFPNDPNSAVDNYLNPFRMIGSMADDLSQTLVNPDASAMDYVRAVGMPLGVGAVAGIGANTAGQFVNNLANPLAGVDLTRIPKGLYNAGKIIVNEGPAELNNLIKSLPLNTLSKAKNLREVVGVAKGIPTPGSLARMGKNQLRDARAIQEIGRMESSGKKFYDIIDYAKANLSDEAFAKSFNGSKQQMGEYATRYRSPNAPNPSVMDARVNELPLVPDANQLPPPPDEIFFDPNAASAHSVTGGSDSYIGDPNSAARRDFGTYATEDDAWYAYQARRESSGLPAAERNNHQYVPEIGTFVDTTIGQHTPRVWQQQPITDAPIGNAQLPVEAFDQFENRFINGPESASAEPSYHQLNTDDYDDVVRDGMDPWERLAASQRNTAYSRMSPLERAKYDVNESARDFNKTVLNKVKNTIGDSYSAYPRYRGEVKSRVPSLFMGPEGKKGVEQTIANAVEHISPGEVATGSINTSHNSWLPQVKQVFGFTEGKPQFLGYEKMNSSGYLTKAGYKPEEVGAYLNTELDDLMRRGKLPKNVLRPYQDPKTGSLLLPQYGVKKLQYGGFNNAQDVYNYLFSDDDEQGERTDSKNVTEVDDQDETQPGTQEINHEELMVEAVYPERNRYRERMMGERKVSATDGLTGTGTVAANTAGGYTAGDRGQYAFNYLKQKGLPPHVAAGMVGNFVQESGNFREDVIAGTRKGDSGLATGIAQWHPDRWNVAVKWNQARGVNPYTLEGQLDFALHEATQRGDIDKTMKARNSAEAANIFGKYYERPKILDPNRAKFAQRYHYKHGGVYNDLFKTEQ